MKRSRTALAFVASFVLVTAFQFAAIAADPSPPADGPPPQARAAMQQIRDGAKADAFKSLSPAHASQVQSIVDKVVGGDVQPRDGASQIDDVLSDPEKQSVLAAEQRMRDAMRKAMDANGGPGVGSPAGAPGGAPASGGPGMGAGPGAPGGPGSGGQGGPGGAGRRAPDAGRFLLGVSIPPDKMRELREKMRQGS